MKFFVYIILLFALPVMAYAQRTKNSCYDYRFGDKIFRTPVSELDIGKKGENVIWDFSNLKLDSENNPVEYISEGEGVIACIDHNTRYYYSQNQAGISLVGYENNYIKSEYDSPETVIPYPFEYGAQRRGVFHGCSMYSERNMMREFGTYITCVDAQGCIILPTGKQLPNVYRIHSEKNVVHITYPDIHTHKVLVERIDSLQPFPEDSIKSYLAQNPEKTFVLDRYYWYAEGYRYPIFEASAIRVANSKSEKLIASYCSPEEQEKLYDSENENSRQRTGTQQGLKSQREIVDTPNASVGSNDYELFQNGKSIIIQYNGDTSNGIYAVLSDTSGIIYKKSNVSVSSSVALDCSGLRPADYVLYLYVANKVYNSKVHYTGQ